MRRSTDITSYHRGTPGSHKIVGMAWAVVELTVTVTGADPATRALGNGALVVIGAGVADVVLGMH